MSLESEQLPFEVFVSKLSEAMRLDRTRITTTLSNVFSMRMIGNKTHGDLAEVALVEFVNSHLDDHTALHVGKDLFRSKRSEEDIVVTDPDNNEISISLKAYGVGPLQLSTNKDSSMFKMLTQVVAQGQLADAERVRTILNSSAFNDFHKVNVLPLIYDEKKMLFNIIVFNVRQAYQAVAKIAYVSSGSGRKHPVYRFLTHDDQYIFEVRYGGVDANALQRGMWTHTTNASPFFSELTGWTKYEINRTILDLVPKLLNSDEAKLKQIMLTFYDVPMSG